MSKGKSFPIPPYRVQKLLGVRPNGRAWGLLPSASLRAAPQWGTVNVYTNRTVAERTLLNRQTDGETVRINRHADTLLGFMR